MIGDKIRSDAYVQTMEQVIDEDSVVIDIGTGTGIFAMVAARLGARHVYAIEPSDAILVARETAARNGLSGKITFFQEMSTDVMLPEKVTVIVSDLRGKVPLFSQHIPSIIDARERLLAPGGVLIPRQDRIWAALVSAPDLFEEAVLPWKGNTYDFDLSAPQKYLRNYWMGKRIKEEQIVSAGQLWATLDYSQINQPNVSGELRWPIAKDVTVHGFTMWFDALLAPDIGYSTHPREPELVYGNSFIPWKQPVDLLAGDVVAMQIKANLVGDSYVWRWDTQIVEQGDPSRVRAQFKQSTLFGEPISIERMSRRDLAHQPALSKKGKITQHILNLMDGQRPVREIAEQVFAQDPDLFEDEESALESVRILSQNFSE